MPVPLPNPAANTPLPPQPQEPPTREDIANAIAYNEKVLVSHEAGVATEDQVRAGAVYEAALIAQNAGDTVAPPWFAPAFAAGLARALRAAQITHNCLAGDGRVRRFEVIPFHDGTLPTDPPHNLPPLVNVAAINALTGPRATAYLQGYGRPIPRSVAARRRAIRDTVGCTAES